MAGTKRTTRVTIALASIVAAAAVSLFVRHAWRVHGVTTAHAVPTLRATDGDVRIERGGSPAGAVDRLPLELGAQDRVETADGHAEMNLASGAVVDLAPKSEFGLGMADRKNGGLDEQVTLAFGKILVHVPKLANGSSLRVGTPNAMVTVHGTVFTVEVRLASAGTVAVTTVSVKEGRVSVASGGREIFLDPGASWSSGAADASTAVPPLVPAAESGDVGRGTRNVPGPSRSTLGEENALFRAAMASRGEGNPKRTVELVDRLLSKYPTSPLSSEARAERSRALAEIQASSVPSSP